MSDRGTNPYQKRRNLRRGIAFGLILISFLALLSDRQQKTLLSSGRLQADSVSARIMGWVAVPVRGVQTLFSDIGERTKAYRYNKVLKAEIARLRPFETRAYNLEIQVKKLQEILDVDADFDVEMDKIPARSVSEINGPFAHTALINVGKNKGVQINNPVMTTDGLYGHIIASGKTASRVLLLNDLNSRIAVMSTRSQSRAIMVGGNTHMPKLDYISTQADWAPGDRIVTSGDGGVLPMGLEIGTALLNEDGRFGVSLSVRDKPVDWVWVYAFVPTQKPEAGDAGE